MPEMNKNNQEAVSEALQSTGLQRKKNRVEVVIHTMPKRFLDIPDQSVQKGKNIGLYIIVGGSIVLIIVLALLYFYLSKTPVSDVAVVNRESAGQNNAAVPSANTASEGEDEDLNNRTPVDNDRPSSPSRTDEKVFIDEKSLAEGDKESAPPSTVIDAGEFASSTEMVATGTADTSRTETGNVTPVVLKAANDSDGDGLSDIEELLLNSNPRAKDSDGDSYEDPAELAKLYNPAGSGKIIVNPNIEKYTNPQYNYSVYYPKSWMTNNGAGNNSVVFQIGGDEFVQILLEPKFEQATLDEWYKEQFKLDYIDPGQKLFKTGWAGIKSDDQLIVYLYNPSHEYLVVVSYNPGSDTLKYPNIFEMMVASLEFVN